jgi:hypothetical protein
MKEGFCLPAQLDLCRIYEEELRLVEPHVGAQRPCEGGMLLRWIVAEQQNCGSRAGIAQGGGAIGVAGQCANEADVVGSAVMVDIVGAEHGACELLQQIVLFVGSAVGADDANCARALGIAHFLQLLRRMLERELPRRGGEATVCLADERLGKAVGMIGEVEGVAPLDAEEIFVDTALIAVVAAHNLRAVIGAADTERCFAAIAAVRADGGDVVHLPRPRLVAIGA